MRRSDDSRRDKRLRVWDHQAPGGGGQWRGKNRCEEGTSLGGPPPGVVDLLTNAVSLNVNGNVFDKLHVYSVKFENADRLLSFKDDRLKGYLLGHNDVRGHLPEFGCFLDYRDEHGMKIYAAQLHGRNPSVAERLSKIPADGVEVLIRSRRGGDETWRVIIQEEKGSPLRSPSDNITLFMQFTNHVAKKIITNFARYTLLDSDRRMVNMDLRAPGVQRLRAGFLIPGYSKNIICLQNGQIIWTFKPQYTLMLDLDLQEYINELKTGCNSTQDLNIMLTQKRLTLSTCYKPSNLYRFLKVVEDVKLGDEFEVTIRKNDQLMKKTLTRLAYFRTTYPEDPKVATYPNIEDADMVGVSIISGKQNRGKSGRMVYIPAPFLNVMNVLSSSLSATTRMEITRASQKKAVEAFTDIKRLSQELNTPAICDEFEKYGFNFDSNIVRIQGYNNISSIISVEAAGGRVRLAYDDQCSFIRDFTRAEHACAPKINEWLFIAKVDRHGQFPRRIAERVMEDLVFLARQRGWEWRYRKFEDGRIISFTDANDIDREVHSCLRDFKTAPRPDLIIGLIPERDDHDYACVKRFAYRLGCPSQVITENLVQRLGSKAFWKVLSGLCGKLLPLLPPAGQTAPYHYHPWRLKEAPSMDFDKIVHSDGSRGSTSTVCIAISSYKQSQQARGPGGVMGWGVAATTSGDCTGLIQDFGELDAADQSLFPRLDRVLEPTLKRLYYTYHLNCRNLIIYRRGISEGLLPRLLQTEIPAIRKALKTIIGSQDYTEDDRMLLISWPERLKEKGLYEVEVPCRKNGNREYLILSANLEKFRHEDGKPVSILKLTIPAEVEFDNQDSVRIRPPNAGNFVAMPPRPRLCFIVINRSSTSSLLTFSARLNPQARDPRLTPGGTVIHSDQIVSTPRYTVTQDEFYIVPGSGPMGFAAPVHYIILQNELGLTTQILSDITLKLSFLFYNHQGSNKTPHLVRVAETASEQALTVYRGIQQEVEADQKKINKFVNQAEVDRLKDSAIFL